MLGEHHACNSMMLSSSDLQPTIYMRYIDDIFGVWTHGPDALDKFFEYLNNFHPSLKLSIERSDQTDKKQIPILDTLVKIEDNGSLTTELYIKPMASDIILPFASAHPIQTKKSVLYAQLLRAKRLGSSRSAQDRGMNKIESLFRSNGYPAKMIRKTKFLVKSRNHRKPSETRKQSDPFSDSTFISLPFIDDHLSGKIESLVKNSKLPVRVAWQSGQTLRQKSSRHLL